MKRIIALILVLASVFALCACGSSSSSGKKPDRTDPAPSKPAATAAVIPCHTATTAAVAEQQHQNDDPPPIVVQTAANTVIIVAHKITSKMLLSIAAHTTSYDRPHFLCSPENFLVN